MDADTVLKIWAVVGPLLTAALSAIWARRIQIQDREHQKFLQEQIRADEYRVKDMEFKLSTNHSQMSELRAAIASLLASSNSYVLASIDDNSSRRSHDSIRSLRESEERLNVQFQCVAILAPESLAALATELLNAAISISSLNAPDLEKKLENGSARYNAAKNELTKKSRDLLGLKPEA